MPAQIFNNDPKAICDRLRDLANQYPMPPELENYPGKTRRPSIARMAEIILECAVQMEPGTLYGWIENTYRPAIEPDPAISVTPIEPQGESSEPASTEADTFTDE